MSGRGEDDERGRTRSTSTATSRPEVVGVVVEVVFVIGHDEICWIGIKACFVSKKREDKLST